MQKTKVFWVTPKTLILTPDLSLVFTIHFAQMKLSENWSLHPFVKHIPLRAEVQERLW